MLAIVLALASAISYGGSDFAAGLASRRVSVIQVTLVASVASLVVVAAAVPFAAAHPPQAAALSGPATLNAACRNPRYSANAPTVPPSPAAAPQASAAACGG